MAQFNFPGDFKFGFSMSAFQFEMGLPGSENPYSDWWVWVHNPDNICAGVVSGDLPEDGPGYWHLYKVDHDIADRLGLNSARLCLSWSRIFPKPTFEVEVECEVKGDNILHIDVKERHLEKLDRLASRKAVKRYREILSDWKGRGKHLILNLYHFSMPKWLHNPLRARETCLREGPTGWLDKRTVVEFAKYVAYAVWMFDDLVDEWVTMNEPRAVYTEGYWTVKSGFPPGILSLKAMLKAKKNLVEAHARAYDVIKTFSKKPVGLLYDVYAIEPLNRGDEKAAEEARKTEVYDFLNAVTRGVISWLEGEVREDLKGKLDWLGVNYYTRLVVTSVKGPPGFGWRPVPGYGRNCKPNSLSKDGRPTSDFGWEFYPEGLKNVLVDLYERYRLPLMVTENGVADEKDILRPSFVVSHLYQVYLALKEGVNVRGYLHWALTDNYEWAHGFSMRFGLCHVDFKTKKRFLRPSAFILGEIARRKGIPEELQHLAKPAIREKGSTWR